jgi:hypothetical protein
MLPRAVTVWVLEILCGSNSLKNVKTLSNLKQQSSDRQNIMYLVFSLMVAADEPITARRLKRRVELA